MNGPIVVPFGSSRRQADSWAPAKPRRGLEAAVKQHGFGVLHVHDLGETLRSKGVDFAEQCKVFEVCNPVQAAKVLASDMRLTMALPLRV